MQGLLMHPPVPQHHTNADDDKLDGADDQHDDRHAGAYIFDDGG